EPLDGDLVRPLGPVILADLEVLTVDAAEVAVAEEDVARSLRAREKGLLSEVGRVGRNDGVLSGRAGREDSGEAIVAAVARADRAGLQERVELLDALFELARLEQRQIPGLVHSDELSIGPVRESWKSRVMRWRFNLFPAWRGTGARIDYIAEDWREVRV